MLNPTRDDELQPSSDGVFNVVHHQHIGRVGGRARQVMEGGVANHRCDPVPWRVNVPGRWPVPELWLCGCAKHQKEYADRHGWVVKMEGALVFLLLWCGVNNVNESSAMSQK